MMYYDMTRNYKRIQLEYPLKGPKNGWGLSGEFGTTRDIDSKTVYIMNKTSPDETRNGFQLMLHDPFEVVSDEAVQLFPVCHKVNDYSIKPEVFGYDESLLAFTPEERNCLLPGERQLEFFKVYNRPNCEHECLANDMLKACGCVAFFMVRNESTKICSAADEKCFRRVEESFQSTKSNCKCYHACERVRYDVSQITNGHQT
jgi:hypothetical protein